ncbi:hypothetical protein BJ742DRAFT_793518 [Cladochytrium replicatum]|nr:hypothetical protein BJ742DRAFT_844033 [Cladochytrium replicatum]KAI8812248.1 hypothetical protein BJ742DRAFT_793518 [Cladochytrium replicatum]
MSPARENTPSPERVRVVIKFTLPKERLDHDESIYTGKYDPTLVRPSESVTVEARDLREEVDAAEKVPVETQLAQRGYAVSKQPSSFINDIPSAEGTERYLEECCNILREAVGCTRVIAWNSVCRKNDENAALKDVPKQNGPEKGFLPSSRVQPIAGIAHVDQDEVWGKELCSLAIGAPADNFKRVQIINIWRPLSGPVTNAPLAMLEFHEIGRSDISKHTSMFGTGMDLHYSPIQQWAYIRHQQPDEIIFLKCYDTAQGSDGSALYCGHVAATVDDSEGILPELVKPRESIEVRLVAIWE